MPWSEIWDFIQSIPAPKILSEGAFGLSSEVCAWLDKVLFGGSILLAAWFFFKFILPLLKKAVKFILFRENIFQRLGLRTPQMEYDQRDKISFAQRGYKDVIRLLKKLSQELHSQCDGYSVAVNAEDNHKAVVQVFRDGEKRSEFYLVLNLTDDVNIGVVREGTEPGYFNKIYDVGNDQGKLCFFGYSVLMDAKGIAADIWKEFIDSVLKN